MPDCCSKVISRIVSIDAFSQSVVPSYFGDHGSRAYDWGGNLVGSYNRFANQTYDNNGRVVTLSGSVNDDHYQSPRHSDCLSGIKGPETKQPPNFTYKWREIRVQASMLR
jgi:hypothetical protein